jgi:hypothetical protein
MFIVMISSKADAVSAHGSRWSQQNATCAPLQLMVGCKLWVVFTVLYAKGSARAGLTAEARELMYVSRTGFSEDQSAVGRIDDVVLIAQPVGLRQTRKSLQFIAKRSMRT